MDEKSEPWYTNENVPENLLKVVQRTSDKDWNRELINDYKIRFKLSTGPLVRFILLQSPEISEVLIICHHVICDGTIFEFEFIDRVNVRKELMNKRKK